MLPSDSKQQPTVGEIHPLKLIGGMFLGVITLNQPFVALSDWNPNVQSSKWNNSS